MLSARRPTQVASARRLHQMTIDPALVHIAATAVALTLLGLLCRYFRQSALIGYLVAGILLGPGVLGMFADPSVLDPIAGTGLVLLLFFIGLEVDVGQRSSRWHIALIGTLLQTLLSVGLVAAVRCSWGSCSRSAVRRSRSNISPRSRG